MLVQGTSPEASSSACLRGRFTRSWKYLMIYDPCGSPYTPPEDMPTSLYAPCIPYIPFVMTFASVAFMAGRCCCSTTCEITVYPVLTECPSTSAVTPSQSPLWPKKEDGRRKPPLRRQHDRPQQQSDNATPPTPISLLPRLHDAMMTSLYSVLGSSPPNSQQREYSLSREWGLK